VYKNGINQLLIITLLTLTWNASLFAAAYDPTRPPMLNPIQKPANVAVVKTKKVNPRDYKVTSILISGERKVAVINNQVVSLGDTVKGGKHGPVTVKAITTSAVILVKARQQFSVRLPSSEYPKTSLDEGGKKKDIH
jgi:hypothetical protein